jgi:hypothetical protein
MHSPTRLEGASEGEHLLQLRPPLPLLLLLLQLILLQLILIIP